MCLAKPTWAGLIVCNTNHAVTPSFGRIQCRLEKSNIHKKFTELPPFRMPPTTILLLLRTSAYKLPGRYKNEEVNITSYLILSYLSRSMDDRWGTTEDFTTSFLHSLRFSIFRSSIFHFWPVHSLMLSSPSFPLSASSSPSLNCIL